MVTPNFKDNKYKRLFCPNCKTFLAELRLDDKKGALTTCSRCKTKYWIEPPKKVNNGEHKIIKYGIGGESYTADLTEYEGEQTI